MKILNKKGDGGVSNLVLFIGVILVAAIASSVLVTTAVNLQNQALLSGQRAEEEILVAAKIVIMYGEDGTNPAGTLRNFYMKIRLLPGTIPIKLDDTFLGADFAESSVNLYAILQNESERNCTLGSGPNDSGFWTDSATKVGNFSYIYLAKSPSWKDRYLYPGDIIVVCFRAPYEIPESSPMGIQFIPKPGTAVVIETATPDEILKVREEIYS